MASNADSVLTHTPMEFEVVAEGLAFPEGPVVMPDGSVVVVEIGNGRVTRVWGGGRKEVVVELGGGPNGAQLGADGALYVCNNGGVDPQAGVYLDGPQNIGRIERVDLSTGAVDRLFDHCDGEPLDGPNDLVIDRTGGIWFTDWGKLLRRYKGRGGIYYCRPDGSSIRKAFSGIDFASYNGIGLSPDETTLYAADTASCRIISYDLSAPGQMVTDKAGPRGIPGMMVARVPGDLSLDSLAVTASGNICVGTIWTGGIARVDVKAGFTEHLRFPDTFVTNIAFGGPDMRMAYITLSSTGKLIRVKWPERGLKLNFG